MKSFVFIRKLIEANRFEDYKKNSWSGADVVIVSPEVGEEKIKNLKIWEDESNSRKLVITKHASAAIWFIETLKPYVNYDYLNKYDYYTEIADYIIDNEMLNEKDLLLSLLKQLGSPTNKRKKSWEKTLEAEKEDAKILDARIHNRPLDWQSWYNYGVEHNDPFFVKFMTLWIAFNEQYKKNPQYNSKGNVDERLTIENFCKENIQKLLDKYDDVFIKSKLIEAFRGKNDKEEYYIRDMRIYSDHSPYKTRDDEERIINYRKNDIKNLKSDDPKKATLALFNAMYAVRCNLFHGGKDATNERDIELVRCSGEILEIYLKALM